MQAYKEMKSFVFGQDMQKENQDLHTEWRK